MKLAALLLALAGAVCFGCGMLALIFVPALRNDMTGKIAVGGFLVFFVFGFFLGDDL